MLAVTNTTRPPQGGTSVDPITLPNLGFANPLTGRYVTPGDPGLPARRPTDPRGRGRLRRRRHRRGWRRQRRPDRRHRPGRRRHQKPSYEGDVDKERHERALAAAREGEKKAKAEKKAADERVAAVLKAAGLTPDGKTDPAEQLKAAAAERDKADQKYRDKSLRLSVRENADKAGVDSTATLDSSAFRQSVAELDPDAADYDDQVVAAMKKALKANPRLAATAAQGPASRAPTTTAGAARRASRRTSPKPSPPAWAVDPE
ncbi:hypothetical protein NKG94_34530 [Micromonospora sp. M12]